MKISEILNRNEAMRTAVRIFDERTEDRLVIDGPQGWRQILRAEHPDEVDVYLNGFGAEIIVKNREAVWNV